MAGSKVLVLGGTGPAGLCLLRELASRQQHAIVYARNVSKIPSDLAANEFLEILQGEIDDLDSLSRAIAQCSSVLSLLGPHLTDRIANSSLYADMYRNIFTLMRQHGVRRILAMGTPSIQRPEDSWTIIQPIIVLFVRTLHSSVYRNIINVANAFERDATGLDWTVFRIGQILGESDELSWKADREAGEPFVGQIGEKGWSLPLKRGLLARWLADAAAGRADDWIGKCRLLASPNNRDKKAPYLSR
ncbi:hypothetical protein GGR51DRAFT_497778 [Nemania sp. FL0031]|nr:hypothetical protein GGR51DRAFT_497778 [Nemania sp. FL0031]